MNKRMPRVGTLCVFLCLLFVRQTIADDGTKWEWGPPSDGCQMSVRLAKASYKPGEKIFGFVTVTNMNATSVVLPVGHKSATLDFLLILTDEQGKPVSPSKFAKDLNEFGGVLDKTIFAGTSYTVTIPVGICFQLDAPGVYLFHVAHQYEVNDPRASGKLVSNTVKFEIVPAEAKKPAPDK